MKKRIFRIFSLILTLALVSALLPTAVFAADSTVSTLSELIAAFDAAPTDGTAVTIKMAADITLEELPPVKTGTNITLDLNGKTMDLDEKSFYIGTNVVFTLTDSATGGTITGGSGGHGGAFFVHKGGKFIMNGGTIRNCTANDSYGGGAIFVNNSSTFIMNGGVIENCSTVDAYGDGGGICIWDKSSLIMSGGTIRNCTAGRHGGGIFVNSGCTFQTMTGVTITGCSANNGGGGLNSGAKNTAVSNCVITDNSSATSLGHQICCAETDSMTITGYCTIENDDENDLLNVTNGGTTSKINLNNMGGSGGTACVDPVTWNGELPSVTVPTRAGSTFDGYYDAAIGGSQYYNADGTSAKAWDKIAAEATLYAHWTQHGVQIFTDVCDDAETEEIENALSLNVFAVSNVGDGDGYADITYYFTIEWEVSGESIQLHENGIYVWNPETMQYEKDETQKDFSLGESTSLDMTITVTNRSNAEAKYAVSYADSNDDLTTVESQKDDSENNASGTLASADQNGAAAAAPNSGHAYAITAELIDAEENVAPSIVYSGTVTVTALADEAVFADQDELTLGVYTVTLSAE